MDARQPAFQILAALLHYPDEVLLVDIDAVRVEIAAASLLRHDEAAAIDTFVQALAAEDLIEIQARYVETFDRGRARSLYLFEHVYGESRDRGQAMVELSRIYRDHGLEIATRELPDYLPLYLEFLSRLPSTAALARLAEIAPLVQHLHAQLAKRDSGYAVLLQPLLRLSGVAADDPNLREQVAGEAPDDTAAALDAVWMEAPVTFSSAATCRDNGGEATEQTIEWQDRRASGTPDRPPGGQ